MVMGPCGGVRPDGGCEVGAQPCVFPVPVAWTDPVPPVPLDAVPLILTDFSSEPYSVPAHAAVAGILGPASSLRRSSCSGPFRRTSVVAVVTATGIVRVANEPWRARKNSPDRRAAPMKLPPVEYEAPTTVAEAIDLLAEHLDEASVLAGGQSLIPLLALRLARPAVLIDINGIDELSGVSAADGWVAIGAMTREYIAEESEDGRRCRAVAGGRSAIDRS